MPIVAASGALAAPASAAGGYAPLSAPGPKLSDSRAALRASLTCSGSLRNTDRRPVLLLSGTTVDPVENFAWRGRGAATLVCRRAEDK